MRKVKIIVPICERREEEILEQVKCIVRKPVEVVELRADLMESLKKVPLKELVEKMREISGEKLAFLLTYRSKREGGKGAYSPKEQAHFLQENGVLFDYVDIEASLPSKERLQLETFFEDKPTRTILSKHDFSRTPTIEAIKALLRQMNQENVDILKIAFMPNKPVDVLNLMDGVKSFRKKFHTPVIAMSMGEMGALSRVMGEDFKSFATFATVGTSSAPGQMSVAVTLRAMQDVEKIRPLIDKITKLKESARKEVLEQGKEAMYEQTQEELFYEYTRILNVPNARDEGV